MPICTMRDMGDPESPEVAQAKAALARFDAAYREATAAIDAVQDLDVAFKLEGKLAAACGAREAESAQRRARIATQIYSGERLSLAQLAERIDRSRSYAQDLVEKGSGRWKPRGQRPAREADG